MPYLDPVGRYTPTSLETSRAAAARYAHVSVVAPARSTGPVAGHPFLASLRRRLRMPVGPVRRDPVAGSPRS